MKATIGISRNRLINGIIFFFMIIPYLLPQYIEMRIQAIPFAYPLMTYISLFAIGYFYILNYQKFVRGEAVFYLTFILFLLMYFSLILSTVLNGGDVYQSVSHSVRVLALCLIVYFISTNRTMCTILLNIICWVVMAFCVLNVLYIIILPNGIPEMMTESMNDVPKHLFGNVNATIRATYPGICASFVLDRFQKKSISIRSIVFFLTLIFICVRLYFMATAIICIVFLLCWKLFQSIISKRLKLFYLLMLAAVLIIELVIVLQVNNDSGFGEMITGLFGKSADFSGRRFLWNNALLRISLQPITGYGFKSADELAFFLGNKYGCHNYYLDIVFQRGFFGFAISLIIWLAPLFIIKRKQVVDSVTYDLLGLSSALYFMFMSEPFFNSEYRVIPLFFVLIIRLGHIRFSLKSNRGQNMITRNQQPN